MIDEVNDMDRRAFKNLMTKKSSIWTLSLCLTGAVVLGGIAVMDSSRNSSELPLESEYDELAYLEEEYKGNASGEGQEKQTEKMAEVSANSVDNSADPALDGEDQEVDPDAQAVDSDVQAANSDAQAGNSDAADADAQVTDADSVQSDASADVYSASVLSAQQLIDAGIDFSDADTLMWPSAGTILIDYSMDGTVYFPTLNQYKYNPALIIGSETGNQVIASAKGIVESIAVEEETGNTLVLNIGNGYRLTYGQLKELAVEQGDIVEQGALLGYVSEPTRYYSEEGSNLYFAMKQEESAVDPVLYLE